MTIRQREIAKKSKVGGNAGTTKAGAGEAKAGKAKMGKVTCCTSNF